MKIKRKIRQQAHAGLLSDRAARRAAKARSWFKRFSASVVALGFTYYNKLITWRHSLMDGLP